MRKFVSVCLLFLKNNIHIVAWVVLVFSVLISVFIRSPFAFYDEHVHYVRAVGVGNGQLLSYSKENSSSEYGHDIDKANVEYIDSYVGKERTEVSFTWTKDKEGDPKLGNGQVYKVNTSAAPYTPVPYFSFGLASKIAQAINMSVRAEFILMRLLGAVVALGLLFAAYRISPDRYRWTLLVIAMIPMSIASFAAITTDGFNIAASLLFFASLLRCVQYIGKRKLLNKDMAILFGSSLLVVGSKMPAFLLIALILGVIVIYWKKLSRKQVVYLASIVGVSAVITLLWAYYAKDINTGAFWDRGTDTMGQLAYIASHPVTFVKNLIFSVVSYGYHNITFGLYANDRFYTDIPFIFDIIIIAGILLSPFLESRQQKPTKEHRRLYWAQVGLLCIIVVSIFTLLFLQYNAVGTVDRIEGVQSRYFVPFIVLLAASPYTMKLSSNWRKFAIAAPFIGVAVYLGFYAMQTI